MDQLLKKWGLKIAKTWLQDSQGFTSEKIGHWDISNITVKDDGSWSYSNITTQYCSLSKALEKGDGYSDRASGKELPTTKSQYLLVVPDMPMSNKEFYENVFKAFEEIKTQEKVPARELLENEQAYQKCRSDLLEGFEQFFGRKK